MQRTSPPQRQSNSQGPQTDGRCMSDVHLRWLRKIHCEIALLALPRGNKSRGEVGSPRVRARGKLNALRASNASPGSVSSSAPFPPPLRPSNSPLVLWRRVCPNFETPMGRIPMCNSWAMRPSRNARASPKPCGAIAQTHKPQAPQAPGRWESGSGWFYLRLLRLCFCLRPEARDMMPRGPAVRLGAPDASCG